MIGRLGDRPEVFEQPVLGRLAVIGDDREHRVDARFDGALGEFDRMLGVVAARSGHDRAAIAQPAFDRSRTAPASRASRAPAIRRSFR